MEFKDMINKIINCYCYDMIKNIPDNSIDLVIIDPPYEFNMSDGGVPLVPNKEIIIKNIYLYIMKQVLQKILKD